MASRKKTKSRTRPQASSASRTKKPITRNQKNQPKTLKSSTKSPKSDSSSRKKSRKTNASSIKKPPNFDSPIKKNPPKKDVASKKKTPLKDDATKNKTDDVQVGNYVLCCGKDGDYHPAKIIERRKLLGGGDGMENCEYYVHYTEFDRRLDEWVTLERLDLNLLQTTSFEDKAVSIIMTRRQKRELARLKNVQLPEELDAELLHEHDDSTNVKNFESIEMGRYEMATWYYSHCEPEYNDCKKLFFCEFCLNYYKRKEQLLRHLRKCALKHPPGNEIYRNGKLSMFEVDGKQNRVYCENLCFLAKMFLYHKLPSIDVETFLFYNLCESDDRGCHMVAYFSKEKDPTVPNNVACILAFPPYQQHGYGKFLIAFSYELSKKERKVGTPERPLSDLGLLGYRRYWTRVILDLFLKHKGNITVKEVSKISAIEVKDITDTLKHLDLMQYKKGEYTICWDVDLFHRHLKEADSAGIEIDIRKLNWTPYKEQ